MAQKPVPFEHQRGPSGPTLAKIRAKSIVDFERAVDKRARELVEGAPPQFNLAPVKELVRQAFSMGYDVVKPPREHVNPV